MRFIHFLRVLLGMPPTTAGVSNIPAPALPPYPIPLSATMSDIPGARGSCATRRWSGKAAIWGNLDLLAARVKRWFHKDGGQAMINVLGGHVDILYASPP